MQVDTLSVIFLQTLFEILLNTRTSFRHMPISFLSHEHTERQASELASEWIHWNELWCWVTLQNRPPPIFKHHNAFQWIQSDAHSDPWRGAWHSVWVYPYLSKYHGVNNFPLVDLWEHVLHARLQDYFCDFSMITSMTWRCL